MRFLKVGEDEEVKVPNVGPADHRSIVTPELYLYFLPNERATSSFLPIIRRRNESAGSNASPRPRPGREKAAHPILAISSSSILPIRSGPALSCTRRHSGAN